ncbi:hypothetical protein [Verminephrobacter aporrectodeae]|nr:hypothetical protein [Verminephrobacter aporrectodeae]
MCAIPCDEPPNRHAVGSASAPGSVYMRLVHVWSGFGTLAYLLRARRLAR